MSLISSTSAIVLLSLSSACLAIPASSSKCQNQCPEDGCDEEPAHPCCANDFCSKGIAEMFSDDDDHKMEGLEEDVQTLQIMVAVLLALVLIILVAVVLIILEPYLKLRKIIGKCFKRRSGPEQRRPTSTQNLRELSVSTIRLANHQQSSESPRPSRLSNQIPHSTPVTAVPTKRQQTAPPTTRTRQPSESTCPEESLDTHIGYDNFGLSTSTLHNHTSSSTSSSNRSLGGIHSTRTMNTTLPDHTPHNSLSTRI